MRCDIEKSCWFDDDYILEGDWVMCALLDLYIKVFEVKDLISREICEQMEDYGWSVEFRAGEMLFSYMCYLKMLPLERNML